MRNFVTRLLLPLPWPFNEQIKILAHHVLRDLLSDIEQAEFYSIILCDETRDVSGIKQLGIVGGW